MFYGLKLTPQANKRLERTRHERASLLSNLGEPLKRSVGHARISSKHSPMLRNSIAVVTGVLLSFALSVAGSRLAWLAIVGNVERSENKNAIVGWMIWQVVAVGPAVAVVVGAFVAIVVRRSVWWLGGVALMPLFVYGVSRGAAVIEVLLSLVYIAFAFVAAFVISRFKRSRVA